MTTAAALAEQSRQIERQRDTGPRAIPRQIDTIRAMLDRQEQERKELTK